MQEISHATPEMVVEKLKKTILLMVVLLPISVIVYFTTGRTLHMALGLSGKFGLLLGFLLAGLTIAASCVDLLRTIHIYKKMNEKVEEKNTKTGIVFMEPLGRYPIANLSIPLFLLFLLVCILSYSILLASPQMSQLYAPESLAVARIAAIVFSILYFAMYRSHKSTKVQPSYLSILRELDVQLMLYAMMVFVGVSLFIVSTFGKALGL